MAFALVDRTVALSGDMFGIKQATQVGAFDRLNDTDASEVDPEAETDMSQTGEGFRND